MKKLVLSAALLITSSLAMISCSNGDYDANPNTNNSGTPPPVIGGGGGGSFDWSGTDPMSAKIDGNAFQASNFTYSGVNGGAFIGGQDGLTIISIAIPENTAAGSVVTLGGTSMIMVTVGGSNIYTTAGGGSGSVKVLENDASHIKGLFQATAKSQSGTSTNVTNGYFNVSK